MKTLVIGSNGNMGQRYCKILESLNVPFDGIDVSPNDVDNNRYIHGKYGRVIIATPTDTHVAIIQRIKRCEPYVPILCEKPPCKTLSEFNELKMWGDLYIVNNWAFVYGDYLKPYTNSVFYDYFRTGKDGLNWDCFQLYVLTLGISPKIDNKSLYFHCIINRKKVNQEQIDRSYIKMIKAFTRGHTKVLWNWNTVEPAFRTIYTKEGE